MSRVPTARRGEGQPMALGKQLDSLLGPQHAALRTYVKAGGRRRYRNGFLAGEHTAVSEDTGVSIMDTISQEKDT